MSLGPIKDDLAALAREQGRERVLVLLGGVVVRDDWRKIESALQHRGHLVPGLEHLATVNAADLEALEDDLVPVDRHVRRRNAEQRNLAAVVHVLEHARERFRYAGHLEAAVEAVGHPEMGHDTAQALALDVDDAGCPHAPSEPEPIVVDVGDYDVPGSDMLGDRRGHDADRSRAGDQHVLADQVERERGMSGVAERIEDRREIVGDVVGNPKRVERRDHQVLGECAFTIDAHADGVSAQVPPPRATVAAEAAGDVTFARHAVADLEAAYFLTDLDDLADVLVADVHGHGNGLLCPVVPIPDVQVGAADRGFANADHDVVVAHFGLFHARQREPRRPLEFGQSLHRITPSAFPTLANAATAWSIWSGVCAALIWVRMRALPFGTTGYEKPIT